MNKSLFSLLRYFIFIYLIINSSFSIAQKLPNLQTTSIRIPKSLKIDGQATEWGNKFQAYNHSTDVFYSIANNEKYLCIIIQATDVDILKKIIRGGLTISINPKENGYGSNCKAIQFPLIKLTDEAKLNYVLAEIKELKSTTSKSDKKIDSLVKVYNAFLQSISKEIKISTRYSTPDSTLSIYNDKGISVGGALDNNTLLTYEFKIPFEALDIPYVKTRKIHYNVKLNGRYAMPSVKPAGVYAVSAYTVTNVSLSLFSPTDFWGEYELL